MLISWESSVYRSQDKPILEIRKELKEEPFPGFTRFCWDIDEIAAVSLSWQEVLKSVKGVSEILRVRPKA